MAGKLNLPPHFKNYAIGGVIGLLVGAGGMALFGGDGLSGGDPVVATYNGKNLRASEAFAPVKSRLFQLEDEVYRTKEQAINDTVEQRLIDAEARKQNVSVDQLLEKMTGGPVAEVTDEEISTFLASKNLKLDDPRIKKDDVREYLKYRQRFEKRQGFVADLKKNASVVIKVKEPSAPKLEVTTDGYPSWGNPKAPVTIVEFSDFQCPFCSRALPVLAQVKKDYGPDKVRIVFRDMPLPSHDRAVPAALASHCANEQGKFWEFHDALFSDQGKLSDTDLKAVATTLKLDAAKFNECFDSKRHMETVNKSKREAESLGIQATPSFVINGQLIQGAEGYDKFKVKIDKALSGS